MAKTDRKLPGWVDEHLPSEIAHSAIFEFNVRFQDGKTHTVRMLPDLTVDYDTLQAQLTEMPAQYAYWAAMHAELKLSLGVQERMVKAKRGRLTDAVLDSAGKGQVKFTADQVKSLVDKDSDLVAMEVALLTIQRNFNKMWAMMEALKMKFDALRSLAGFKRQELENS